MRSTARLVGLHGAAVGIVWFPLLMAGALTAVTAGDEFGRDLPSPLQGAIVGMAAPYLIPFVWPVALAVGWHEGNLAERIGRGDADALRRARGVIAAQAIAWAAWAAVALLAAVPASRMEPRLARFVWIGPLIVTAAHLALLRSLRAPRPQAQHG